MRWYDRDVILVDVDPCIAGLWAYLIRVSPAEILRIPYVEAVDDLPSWCPQEARDLVGFAMNAAVTAPCRTLSAGRKKLRAAGRIFEGWSEQHRACVAQGVERIRHWRAYCGTYAQIASAGSATWFVDPPYNNKAGAYYKYKSVDYAHLGEWCRAREGQVIVCENEGADWLPFRPFAQLKAGLNNTTGGSREVVWP